MHRVKRGAVEWRTRWHQFDIAVSKRVENVIDDHDVKKEPGESQWSPVGDDDHSREVSDDDDQALDDGK